MLGVRRAQPGLEILGSPVKTHRHRPSPMLVSMAYSLRRRVIWSLRRWFANGTRNWNRPFSSLPVPSTRWINGERRRWRACRYHRPRSHRSSNWSARAKRNWTVIDTPVRSMFFVVSSSKIFFPLPWRTDRDWTFKPISAIAGWPTRSNSTWSIGWPVIRRINRRTFTFLWKAINKCFNAIIRSNNWTNWWNRPSTTRRTSTGNNSALTMPLRSNELDFGWLSWMRFILVARRTVVNNCSNWEFFSIAVNTRPFVVLWNVFSSPLHFPSTFNRSWISPPSSTIPLSKIRSSSPRPRRSKHVWRIRTNWTIWNSSRTSISSFNVWTSSNRPRLPRAVNSIKRWSRRSTFQNTSQSINVCCKSSISTMWWRNPRNRYRQTSRIRRKQSSSSELDVQTSVKRVYFRVWCSSDTPASPTMQDESNGQSTSPARQSPLHAPDLETLMSQLKIDSLESRLQLCSLYSICSSKNQRRLTVSFCLDTLIDLQENHRSSIPSTSITFISADYCFLPRSYAIYFDYLLDILRQHVTPTLVLQQQASSLYSKHLLPTLTPASLRYVYDTKLLGQLLKYVQSSTSVERRWQSHQQKRKLDEEETKLTDEQFIEKIVQHVSNVTQWTDEQRRTAIYNYLIDERQSLLPVDWIARRKVFLKSRLGNKSSICSSASSETCNPWTRWAEVALSTSIQISISVLCISIWERDQQEFICLIALSSHAWVWNGMHCQEKEKRQLEKCGRDIFDACHLAVSSQQDFSLDKEILLFFFFFFFSSDLSR